MRSAESQSLHEAVQASIRRTHIMKLQERIRLLEHWLASTDPKWSYRSVWEKELDHVKQLLVAERDLS
jgi:hypothetical protein